MQFMDIISYFLSQGFLDIFHKFCLGVATKLASDFLKLIAKKLWGSVTKRYRAKLKKINNKRKRIQKSQVKKLPKPSLNKKKTKRKKKKGKR